MEIELTLPTVGLELQLPVVPLANGKRGPSGPLNLQQSSDEDEPAKDIETVDRASSTFSPTLLDHDYENVSSPGSSSTASGPTYIRQPGFTQHAHEVVAKPKIKKKRTTDLLSFKDGLKRREPTPPKHKPKRDPLPMRMRALPQSFWQQPNVSHVSPATNYAVLPPLVKDGEDDSVMHVRPITPPDDKRDATKDVAMVKEKITITVKQEPGTTTVNKISVEKDGVTPQPPKFSREKPERKITVANTDLLYRLFDNIERKDLQLKTKSHTSTHLKRGRPRKVVPCSNKSFLTGEDPYLVNCVTEEIFPQLSLEQRKANSSNCNATLQLVTVRDGDKSVTLPSLSIEQNYPQMLSELVMHI